MLPATETVFWICFFIVLYTYVGYPLLLQILVFVKNIISPPVKYNKIYVPVTLVVAAYNEEDIIEEKIRNCMSLNYPADLIKFIFITDGSSDNTASIVKKYPLILHLHNDERRGKLAAMNRAMEAVKTDIVIFSDANTSLNGDSISTMVTHYADEKVGAVSGEKKIVMAENGVAKGEGLYWKYESWIKGLDSRLYTIVGAAGELFSLRTKLYTTLPEEIIIEDFVQSLLICTKGYVVRYDAGAFSLERASISVRDEMERKIRIAAGGFQAMMYLKKLFNVIRYPILSFQYLSHRVLRWTLCPVALILMFIASAVLAFGDQSPFFTFFTILQGVFYLAGSVGWIRARRNAQPGVFNLPFYFLFMNFCVFAGFRRFVAGRQAAVWKKADRK
jgi:poly-beta-1,6-N-acetyl-D-glucosamine synthase